MSRRCSLPVIFLSSLALEDLLEISYTARNVSEIQVVPRAHRQEPATHPVLLSRRFDRPVYF